MLIGFLYLVTLVRRETCEGFWMIGEELLCCLDV